MNDKIHKQKQKELKEEMNEKGFGWIDGKYIKPPKEYELRNAELCCIDMINSLLCYNCAGYQDAEQVMKYEEEIAYRNYLSDYVELFGRDKVVALIQGQIDSIDSINHSVYTDSEGLTYNSINWKN